MQTLNLISDRWTLLISHARCVGAPLVWEGWRHTNKSLSSRLKSLCEDELLSCSLYQEHPPRYQYELTDKSRDLDDIYNAMMIWGDRHLHKSYKCLKHKYCGGAVDIQYVCKSAGSHTKKDLIAKPVEGCGVQLALSWLYLFCMHSWNLKRLTIKYMKNMI